MCNRGVHCCDHILKGWYFAPKHNYSITNKMLKNGITQNLGKLYRAYILFNTEQHWHYKTPASDVLWRENVIITGKNLERLKISPWLNIYTIGFKIMELVNSRDSFSPHTNVPEPEADEQATERQAVPCWRAGLQHSTFTLLVTRTAQKLH